MLRDRRVRLRYAVVLIAAASTGLIAAGCGDDDDGGEASTQDLQALLPPPEEVGGIKQERTFEWDNPTDFVVQGTYLPANTAPSSAIAAMEDAGFKEGAGAIVVPRNSDPFPVSVAAFDSAEGAAEAQEYLHGQNLEQPCFAACAVAPKEFALKEIPGATAVHQVPIEGELPPQIHPFEAFAMEFTIGPQLFYANVGGPPGAIPPKQFANAAEAIYEHARSELDAQ